MRRQILWFPSILLLALVVISSVTAGTVSPVLLLGLALGQLVALVGAAWLQGGEFVKSAAGLTRDDEE